MAQRSAYLCAAKRRAILFSQAGKTKNPASPAQDFPKEEPHYEAMNETFPDYSGANYLETTAGMLYQ